MPSPTDPQRRSSISPRRGRATVLSTSVALAILALAPALRPAPAAAQARRAAAPALTEELLRPLRFRHIGPGNTSGRITSLAVPAQEDGKTIYAGTAGGGVWKTVNPATTWQPLCDATRPSASIGDVAVAPSDANVLWVGTGERNSLRSQGWGDGVYRSTDGGAAWTHVRAGGDPRDRAHRRPPARTRTSPTSPRWATSGAPTPSAASTRRPTAGGAGRRSSS